MKKKKFVYTTVIFSGLLMLFSCNQDAIFFKISQETAPIKPLIPGTPTNMVEFTRNGTTAMYVASGNTLHWYSHGAWDGGPGSVPQPRGWISGLAVTSDFLYALRFFLGPEKQLMRISKSGGDWEEVKIQPGVEYTILQTIYADSSSTWLFAGARINNVTVQRYGILYLDTATNTLKLLKDDIGLLYGAASDSSNNHYLCTTTGVYTVNESDLSDVKQIGEGTFVGMLKLNSTPKIIVVERDGRIFEVKSSGLIHKVSIDNTATGALALWTDGGRKMLTAGIQRNSNAYGYVEFTVDSDDLPTGSPSEPYTTVDTLTDRYQASLGKYPINHMHQASVAVDPDNRRFFASTVNQGLWSYRNRSGGPQWNAEN